MQHKKLLSLSISAALGLTSSLLLTSVAVAQDDQTDDDELSLEEVIVTGSRIRTVDGFGRTSPVTVVGMDAIASTGSGSRAPPATRPVQAETPGSSAPSSISVSAAPAFGRATTAAGGGAPVKIPMILIRVSRMSWRCTTMSSMPCSSRYSAR